MAGGVLRDDLQEENLYQVQHHYRQCVYIEVADGRIGSVHYLKIPYSQCQDQRERTIGLQLVQDILDRYRVANGQFAAIEVFRLERTLFKIQFTACRYQFEMRGAFGNEENLTRVKGWNMYRKLASGPINISRVIHIQMVGQGRFDVEIKPVKLFKFSLTYIPFSMRAHGVGLGDLQHERGDPTYKSWIMRLADDYLHCIA